MVSKINDTGVRWLLMNNAWFSKIESPPSLVVHAGTVSITVGHENRHVLMRAQNHGGGVACGSNEETTA